MKLYYMRDNHTFCPLPLEIEQAIAVIRDEFADGNSYGMLFTKSIDTSNAPNPHARRDFAEFEPRARAWLAYVLSYKSPADLEYESWRSSAVPSSPSEECAQPRDASGVEGSS